MLLANNNKTKSIHLMKISLQAIAEDDNEAGERDELEPADWPQAWLLNPALMWPKVSVHEIRVSLG